MIILDTNVLSEMMKPKPDRNVQDWLNLQDSNVLFTSSITAAELVAGIETLPAGKRKDDLLDRFHQMLETFTGRICPFDTVSAIAFGTLIGLAQTSGRAISFQDGLIAAIALGKNFRVATRDTSPFKAAGLLVINPWNDIVS